MDSHECPDLKTHYGLLVATLPFIAGYFNWEFEGRFWSLIITITRCQFAVSAVLQLPRTAIKEVPSTYLVGDRVQIWISLLIALRPSVARTIDFIATKEIFYDHLHELTTVIIA